MWCAFVRVGVRLPLPALSIRDGTGRHPCLRNRGPSWCGDARQVHGEVHPLPSAEEDPLAEAVVGPGGAGQVEGEVRQGCVLGGEGTGDDAEHTEVGGEVVIGLLEQLEGKVEFSLGDSLAKIEVDLIGHEDVASMRGKAQGSWGGDAE